MAIALFNPATFYNVGEAVVYDGVTYIFILPHTPGDWDISHVTVLTPAVSYATAVQDFNTIPDYNLSRPLPTSRYKVVYYINNDVMQTPSTFVNDNNTYLPGDTVTILDYAYQHFSIDGVWVYTFLGWSLNKDNLGINFTSGFTTMPVGDLHLYAVWGKESTLSVNGQTVSLKAEYKDAINYLKIPEYFYGVRIKTIGPSAFDGSSIDEIVLPPSITTIAQQAFLNWTGSTLRFIDADVTDKYPYLSILEDAFENTPNLVKIILPYRWRYSNGVIFPNNAVKADVFNIYIRNSKDFMEEKLNIVPPNLVEDYIADVNNPSPGIHYTRYIHWGYND